MYALILAGGVGTRLWPRSRSDVPKQLLPLMGDRTMVQATVERILPVIPIQHIFFATNEGYGSLIAQQIPNLPRPNIVREPSAKHTAACIGLGALHIQQLDPEAVMASLHSDHFIADEEGFRQALLAAEELAREGFLVTLGVTPNKPETGYGYIKRGSVLGRYKRYPAYRVSEFLEKPDLATAEEFLASGRYYWNSGIFIWQISTLMESFGEHMPGLYGQLEQMEQALKFGEPIDEIWQTIRPESIDVGIMERAEKVAMIPIDVGWNDVGSWDAIHEIGQPDQDGNVVIGVDCYMLDTRDSLIHGRDRLIATIGLENVVIIDSGDVILVCARDKSQDVKNVVSWLEKNGRFDLL